MAAFGCFNLLLVPHFYRIENLELQIKKSTLELQILDANTRDYEPGADKEPSLHQLYWCERNLQQSLQKVMARKMELEKQGKMDVHIAAQQTAPHQLDTWINPYSTSMQGSIFQDWIDKGKRVSDSSSNPFASSSQCGNLSFPQIQNPSSYNPIQAQVTFGESSDNSIMNFWHNLCTSTRPISTPLSAVGIQLNNPSQLELEYAHSNWSTNLNYNNNNHTTQHNDHSSVHSDARASNVNGCNYSMEENAMGSNEYVVERTQENDSWEWDDDVLNETFSMDDFRNLD
ncbi:hypothetical protein K7X08_025334 [Anisodus acutangulus]|uniref:Uncharacterized protein n=1 Tax=Anisodus acutangulus TaxID=402998 RepID=A0A9Q1LW41_9SOLA|nr:hypothetical protein K7X08_025334 [Anisodus acutangulus]